MTRTDLERGRFLTTRWSVVLAAASPEEPLRRAALEDLCATYWYPLYAYVRRSGYDADAAADLTQDFFARILEREDLRRVDRERGRFRAYVLAAMKHLLVNRRASGRAAKRGGGRVPVSIDVEDAEVRFDREPRDERTPEAAFERAWAEAAIARAFERLREEQTRIGRGGLFDDLTPALIGTEDGLPYAEVAARHRTSENAVKVAVHRLRGRLGELLREEVGGTVAGHADVEAEIRALFEALGAPAPEPPGAAGGDSAIAP